MLYVFDVGKLVEGMFICYFGIDIGQIQMLELIIVCNEVQVKVVFYLEYVQIFVCVGICFFVIML